MLYQSLADLIVVLHLAVILLATFGGLLLPRWRSLMWLHAPVVSWVALNQFLNLPCPLTLLEQWLRRLGQGVNYEGGFIVRYLGPLAGSDSATVNVLGATAMILLNSLLYWWLLRQRGNPA